MKISIVSGFFNPLHLGHIKMIKAAKELGEKLVVIVNNDVQQMLKKGKIIMDEKERSQIVESIKGVDEVVLCVDKDPTVVESLREVGRKYQGNELIFCNGGDDRSCRDEVPESKSCDEFNIKMIFGVGGKNKENSSSNINRRTGNEE